MGGGKCVGALPSIILHEARQFELPSGLNIACPSAGGHSAFRQMFLVIPLQVPKAKVWQPRSTKLCELPRIIQNYPWISSELPQPLKLITCLKELLFVGSWWFSARHGSRRWWCEVHLAFAGVALLCCFFSRHACSPRGCGWRVARPYLLALCLTHGAWICMCQVRCSHLSSASIFSTLWRV